MRSNRKDANHSIIEQALKRAGAVCIDCTVAPALGFDLLVAFRGKLYIAEVKDGNKPPSQRKLTEGEAARKEQVEYKGVQYNVLESVDDALAMIGAISI
jgi:hypothetical protein